MGMRSIAPAVLLTAVLCAAVLSAGCDTCVDCVCHCKSDNAKPGATIEIRDSSRFDCGQRCENGPDGCGVGKVSYVECVDTKIVNGKPTTVRCAQAAPLPALSAPRAASPRR
jgi:hypothetical protein